MADRRSFAGELGRLTRLLPFARRHLAPLATGGAAAIAVVVLRLALPWPLKALVDPWLADAHAAGGAALPSTQTALVMGTFFLVLAASLGWADKTSRVSFARFSIGVVRDLRSSAFQTAGRRLGRGSGQTGDLIARLVGDTARIKAGIKGFLVHVVTNGVFFLGVSVVFLWLHPPIGLVFAASAVILGVITYLGAAELFRRAGAFRKKEGKLAEAIHRSSALDPGRPSIAKMNRSSGQHEAALTQLQTRATALAHVVFGATVLAAWAVAWQLAAAGRLDTGGLILLAIYSLSLRGPMVQLARQGTRTGKILAGLDRVTQLIGDDAAVADPRLPLLEALELSRVKVRGPRSRGKQRRLGPLDLTLAAGERVALVGGRGSGKTTLLRLLAGAEPKFKGSIRWDGRPVTRATSALLDECAYLADLPDWPRLSLAELLAVDPQGPTPGSFAADVFELCDLEEIVERLPRGLRTKLAGCDVSKRERHALALARVLLRDRSVLLLDDPFVEMSDDVRAGKIATLLELVASTTIVVALGRPLELSCFDRVIELRNGRISTDGPATPRRSGDHDSAHDTSYSTPAPTPGPGSWRRET